MQCVTSRSLLPERGEVPGFRGGRNSGRGINVSKGLREVFRAIVTGLRAPLHDEPRKAVSSGAAMPAKGDIPIQPLGLRWKRRDGRLFARHGGRGGFGTIGHAAASSDANKYRTYPFARQGIVALSWGNRVIARARRGDVFTSACGKDCEGSTLKAWRRPTFERWPRPPPRPRPTGACAPVTQPWPWWSKPDAWVPTPRDRTRRRESTLSGRCGSRPRTAEVGRNAGLT